MTAQAFVSQKHLWRILLFCMALLCSNPAIAAPDRLNIAQLIVLKKVGYTEAQLRETINKTKEGGKYQLQPAQVLALTKAGFSIDFIRWLGIASSPRALDAAQATPKPAPQTRPAPKRPAAQARPAPVRPAARKPTFVYQLPWDRSPTRADTRQAPGSRSVPDNAQPSAARRTTPAPRTIQPIPVRRIPRKAPPPRYIQPSPQVLGLIQELRNGKTVAARKAAAEAMGKIGPPAMGALPYLVATLQLPTLLQYTPTYPLKQTAVWAIGQMGPIAVKAAPYLLAQFRDPLLQQIAKISLDKILLQASITHAPQLVRFLLRLTGARWLEVRTYAFRHLGYLGTLATPAIGVIKAALYVQKPYTQAQALRKYAAIALGQIGQPAHTALFDLFQLFDDHATGPFARRAVAQIATHPQAHTPLFAKVLQTPKMPLSAKLYALKQLQKANAQTLATQLPVFLAALKPIKANPLALRLEVAHTLRLLGSGALPALSLLIKGLSISKTIPTSGPFRLTVARTIGTIGPTAKAAIPALMRAHSDFPEVVAAAQQALDRIILHPTSAWSELTQALQQTSNDFLRIYASKQLLRLRHDPSLRPAPSTADIASLTALQAQPTTPAFYWSRGAYELATQMVQQGRLKAAIKTLKAAIKMGFDDHLIFSISPIWKPHTSNPALQAACQNIRSSAADRHELMWLKREWMAINHDTSMMIIQQMNRKDSGWTIVPQSRIPQHATNSHAVQIDRILVRWRQMVQKTQIMTSDLSRKNHLISMQIINNMGNRKNAFAHQRALFERMRSAREARLRAQARQRSIKQRRYKVPVGLSTAPSTPPPLTSGIPVRLATAKQAKQLQQSAKQAASQKRWKAADKTISQAIKMQPGLADLYYTRADIRTSQTRHDAALKDINKALSLAPQRFEYLIQRCFIYFILRRYALALQDAQEALRTQPQHKYAFVAHLNIAAVLTQQNHYKQALMNIRRAYKLQPHSPVVLANLSYILYRLGYTKRAQQWNQRALNYNNSYDFTLYTRACLLAQNGLWGQALEILRNAYSQGFQWYHMPATEPAFAPLRKMPAFQAITGR